MQRYHYQTTAQLNEHLQSLLLAYNHAKRLKTLRGLTPTNLFAPSGSRTPLSLPETRPNSLWDYTSSESVGNFTALSRELSREKIKASQLTEIQLVARLQRSLLELNH